MYFTVQALFLLISLYLIETAHTIYTTFQKPGNVVEDILSAFVTGLWLIRGSSSPWRCRDTVDKLLFFFFKVGGPLKYRRCIWCPGSTCTFFSQWNVVIFVKPFLTNQKIISVIFLLVGLTNRDRVTTANCVCLLCFCGDVIGPEWAILIGCEIGSVRPFSCSDREWWSFLSRDETMGFVPKRGWAHHGRRASC